ncbi:MAG: 50S ribosomal protein L22 [Candidatus Gottesmanbacteria bacterium GW2011_GWB1_49_7]|uniref:Large ribosomal subunit protein uL22 n=1 Tax=Candidatus Gottesmanbacteria bacterium GW2011_GWB1_49_7 TaxID=1618448 RepID=A0A0G1VY89_9BACT|nr:MAG: ribosomal protein L22, large subunit ribosomal protein L22 [Microgenomates group bacterium GW2011_GWC1_49_7]KKW11431.1 MAG: 50S ribosomal protein L22 [Candidatus Gottesmanbacteria bacterium GW2011_GWB1_49_7]
MHMEYSATSKYVRVSTRKVRLVADSIRKLTPAVALMALTHVPKAAAAPLTKTIASAIANAKQKGAAEESLRFQTIEIMGGPGMKRWNAVSRGQAHAFKKRMTHIRVVLEEKKEKDHGTKN